jgi:hypothetical protein
MTWVFRIVVAVGIVIILANKWCWILEILSAIALFFVVDIVFGEKEKVS